MKIYGIFFVCLMFGKMVDALLKLCNRGLIHPATYKKYQWRHLSDIHPTEANSDWAHLNPTHIDNRHILGPDYCNKYLVFFSFHTPPL